MKTTSLSLFVAAVLFTSSSQIAIAQNQSVPLPEARLCDPFIENLDDDTDDGDRREESRKRLYGQEVRETLTSDAAIMEALYEEKWDLETGDEVARTELCRAEPSFVIHWAELTSQKPSGEIVVLAEGPFSFKKDGSFEFVFEKRPYFGEWALDKHMMSMKADWLNEGASIAAPVEAFTTPVEVRFADGEIQVYDEEGFGVGWFRFQRASTTKKGTFQDCACPTFE